MSSWEAVAGVAIAAAAVALAAWLHLWFWRGRLGTSMPYAEELTLHTADGARIELRRAPPEGDAAPGLPPVLLVHGLGANHRNVDALPERSFARHLTRAGRDVWLVTLRSGLFDLSRRERRLVRFEHMVEHDLPLAIETILERTGAARVDYIGFSMGGMLLYAALGNTIGEDVVRRVVIVGSPILISPPGGIRLPHWLGHLPVWLVPTLRLRFLAALSAPTAEWLRTPLHRVMVNPDNIERGDSRRAMVNLVADIPGPLNLDFARWAFEHAGALVVDGQGVLERLEGVATPALFFAGAADRVAPPRSVEEAYEHWGVRSPGIVKQFVLLGREAGAAADYGHGDLAIGRNASVDLFERAEQFLARSDAPSEPA